MLIAFLPKEEIIRASVPKPFAGAFATRALKTGENCGEP
jgi:hypothetical protein